MTTKKSGKKNWLVEKIYGGKDRLEDLVLRLFLMHIKKNGSSSGTGV